MGRRRLHTIAKPTASKAMPTVPIGSLVFSGEAGGRRRKTKIAAKENQAARIARVVHS
jgi:hypothetical protein